MSQQQTWTIMALEALIPLEVQALSEALAARMFFKTN